MSTTQHPLADETLDRLVSYISGGTIDCSTHEGRYDALSEDDARTIVESLWEPMMQAAQARPAEITDEMVEAGASYAWEEAHPGVLGWNSLTEHHKEGCRRDVRNVLSAALAIAPPAEPLARTLLAVPEGYGAPHHDAGRIKAEDYVMQLDEDGLVRAGIAHHQNGEGDWFTEEGMSITWAEERADRPDAITVWPAPTPPAVEVEMPDEFGAVILNPRWSRWSYTRAVHLGEGVWAAEVTPGADVHTHLARDLRSATLPDGTRARRDGERPDGEPRFVKAQEV